MKCPSFLASVLLLVGIGSSLMAETITIDGGASGLVYSGTVSVGTTSTTAITTVRNVSVPAAANVTYNVNPSGQIVLDPGFTAAMGSTFSARIVAPIATTTIVSGPATVLDGSSTTYRAALVDQFGQAISPQPAFTWSVSGGGSMAPLSGTTASFAAPPSAAAVVISATGQGVVGSLPVAVAFATPTPVITPSLTSFPLGYRLDGSGSSAGSPAYPIISYTWSLPDGTSPTGAVINCSFPTDGPNIVRLTVVDARGTSASTARSVLVAASQDIYFTATDVSTQNGALHSQTYTTYASGGASSYVGKGWLIDYGSNGKGFKPDKGKGTPYCVLNPVGLWTDNFSTVYMNAYQASYAAVGGFYVGRAWIEDTVGNGKNQVLVPDPAFASYVGLSMQSFDIRFPGNRILTISQKVYLANRNSTRTPCFGNGFISGPWHDSGGNLAMQFTPKTSGSGSAPTTIYKSTSYRLIDPLPQYGTQFLFNGDSIYPPVGEPYPGNPFPPPPAYSTLGMGYIYATGLTTIFQPSAAN